MDATRRSVVAGLVVLGALVVLAALLGGGGVAVASGTTAAADTTGPSTLQAPGPGQTSETVQVTQVFAAMPEAPGRVRVTRRVALPDNVVSVRTTLPEGASVTGTSGGFTRVDGRRYEWDGGSRTPAISYTLAVNETGEVAGPEGTSGRYLFVDVGEWGLFQRPDAPLEATYRGSITFEREARVDGPGAAGKRLIYVGEATETRRQAHGQTFRLVEPEAADLVESREAVFDSLTAASDSLRVGDRDREVFVVAAPTSVDWAVEGLQLGEQDMFVTADEPVDEADNVWLHEYVHTRQDFETTRETRWLGEATATYYGALLALEQERIDFEDFRAILASGANSRYESVVLADPDTWTTGANYRKGALVTGALDRRLREATDSQSDLQAVFRRLNERSAPVDGEDLVGIVREAGTDDVARTADRYTTTTAVPEVWDRHTHLDVFGPLPPRIRVSLPEDGWGGRYTVSGPYRTRSSTTSPAVLVPNETLAIDVRIGNDGGRTGTYDVSYGLAESPQGELTGTIDPEETVTETVEIRATTPGTGPVRVGEYALDTVIRAPATAQIAALRVNRSQVSAGGAVGVSVTVTNPADWPGAADVAVRVDGQSVGTETARLDAGANRTLERTVRFEETGTHEVAVGNASVTVTVRAAGPVDGLDGETTVLLAAAALVVAVLVILGLVVARLR